MNVDKIYGKLEREGVSIVSSEDINDIFELKESLDEHTEDSWAIKYIEPEKQEEFSDGNVIFLSTEDSHLHIINADEDGRSATQLSREGEKIVYIVSNIHRLKETPGRWDRIKDFVTEV